jgi:hypothetical protein
VIDINGAEFASKDQNRHHPRGAICWHYSRFRLTCDEYDAMRARAGGSCEICGTAEMETRGRRLVVDHFSGRPASYVRGLVCDRCNSVMSCHDGHKNWGPLTTPWREKAAEYAANSWHSPEQGLRLQEHFGPLDRLS